VTWKYTYYINAVTQSINLAHTKTICLHDILLHSLHATDNWAKTERTQETKIML